MSALPQWVWVHTVATADGRTIVFVNCDLCGRICTTFSHDGAVDECREHARGSRHRANLAAVEHEVH